MTSAQPAEPASVSRWVSYSNVEKVVYAPTKPVATRRRHAGSRSTRSAAHVEKMKTVKPAFDAKGTVTAATSSPLSIGVAVVLLATEKAAKALGLTLRARIVSTAVAGTDYERMGLGPLPSTEKALKRANLKITDMDVIELNEAFAAQALAVIRLGGWGDLAPRINMLGGALAIGHPIGMSGDRIIGTTITALERSKGKRGLATMCVGGGQGASTILERVGS